VARTTARHTRRPALIVGAACVTLNDQRRTGVTHAKRETIRIDLIFEGMWHGFNMEPDLPETRDATEDLVSFLDRHMGS
jgi:hypothetical protein